MSDIAIRVEGLGKLYRRGVAQERHDTLRDALTAAARTPLGWLRRNGHRSEGDDTFWALKNVSFEVRRGKALGVIGRNGAGKSTLLKILSRITEPTEGRAVVQGRVGSLLEVGTGFHPELTGRENVYLNGAILGMRRGEIERRFDEIVAFAEVEDFLDMPVKRYSSGMYVRLAFAVAAHLEPEILLVDEVLAVGDAAFQQKCLGKMGDVAREGRTVLFVSHNLAAVQALCNQGLVLNRGAATAHGDAAEAVSGYLRELEPAPMALNTDWQGDSRNGPLRLVGVSVEGGAGSPGRLISGRPVRFTFELASPDGKSLDQASVAFAIYDHHGLPLAMFNSANEAIGDGHAEPRRRSLVCEVEELPLLPGRYRINVHVHSAGRSQHEVEGAASFDVTAGLIAGKPVGTETRYGSVYMRHRWLPAEVGLSPADTASR